MDRTLHRDMHIRKRICIKGVVQGIGFRPFIYRLANEKDLKGVVFNTEQGITIEVEGEENNIDQFLTDLQKKPPPLAEIIDFNVSTISPQGEKTFLIKESLNGIEPRVLIPPDLAICPDCIKELLDPSDRRYRYPFINCTQCGPRLTIIKKVPYDREHTSMSSFDMCEECKGEFYDPVSRRFHAQPNACSRCGPHVWLSDSQGNHIATDEPIKHAARLIKEGAILGIKGLGGFHLAADATNEDAVGELRRRKAREGKPFAIMSEDLETIRLYAEFSDDEAALLKGAVHPIVLLGKKTNNPIAPSVASNQRSFGIMLPYTPLHVLLLNEGFVALVMTSGNLSDEPIAIKNQEAMESLSGIADYFLFHNREILVRCDDSVVMPNKSEPIIIRRSRGYAPLPIHLARSFDPVLALGGQMKNTICVIREKQAFLSQHVGDLDEPEARRFFWESFKQVQEIAGVSPGIVAHDLHPDYYTTKIIEDMQDKICYAVQHHHAHLVSCMADNGLTGHVIGLIFDGTGYGTDGSIWGGEVLVGNEVSFNRAVHLSPFPLPGGEAAILNPWRIAVGLLYQSFGQDWYHVLSRLLGRILPKNDLNENKLSLINDAITKKINTPSTSSMGRLFDAVSALLGFHGRISYEGQPAIELEYFASLCESPEAYPAEISQEVLPWRMEVNPIIYKIVSDIHNKVPKEIISRKFHNTVICMACEAARLCSRNFSLNRVVLSGGCFQNRLLLEGIFSTLERDGIQVYTHKQVPTNDGGLSLGQAVCAGEFYKSASSGESN
ncbi:MAG: carbamoyltransferase HypF [bacterium]